MAAQLYIVYADADQDGLAELEVQLAPLRSQHRLTWWRRRMPGGSGQDVEAARQEHLGRADIILLLVSPRLNSDMFDELEEVMEQQARGALVIPILWRTTPWKGMSYGQNAPLPNNDQSVTSDGWPTRDEAWFQVMSGISRLLKVVVLFLPANPSDTTRLALQGEFAAIQRKLQQAHYGSSFQLVRPGADEPVSPGRLQALLLGHRPDIVHFSGHGTQDGALILEPDPEEAEGASPRRNMGTEEVVAEGRPGLVQPQQLADLFRLVGHVRCVVLSLCYSAVQAQAITGSVECVIGMSRAIADSSAISFAESFYFALASKKNTKQAFDLGCNQIGLMGRSGPDVPQYLTPRRVRFISE